MSEDYTDAEAAYQQAVDLDPDNPQHHADLGKALFAQRRYDEAEAAYRQAVDLDPDNPQHYADLGKALFARRRYDEAEAAYRRAVDLDPGNAEYYADLAKALYAQQMYDEAEAAYQRAVDLDPGNPEYYADLGDALFVRQREIEAEAAHEQATRLGSDNPQYHTQAGGVLPAQERRHAESEAVHQQAKQLRADKVETEFGILRLEINGSWSVENFTQLLTKLEETYFAAASLESLTEPWAIGGSSITGPREQRATELINAVVAFRLGGGLRVRSLHYGSPGFVEVIGALNPLKTVKDGITENREINRKREETRLFDERERQRQSGEYEQSIKGENRQTEQMRLAHEREMSKLQIRAEEARVKALLSVIDRLPPDQRTTAAAELFQIMTRNTESIANDVRVGEVRMLETGEQTE